MMMKSFFILFLPAIVCAFSKVTKVIKPRGSKTIIDTEIINPPVSKPVIVGSTEPFPKFDPLNFAKDESRVSYLREAELKHGRLAMVASTLMPITELMTHEKSINNFDKLPVQFQSLIISAMFMAEFATMIRGWKNPYTNPFELKDDYQPGDFGFKITRDLQSEESIDLLNKELNNGRMAMMGAIGMIAQELITDKSLFF
jgi:hypothetical protein